MKDTYAINKEHTVKVTRWYSDENASYSYTIQHWNEPYTQKTFLGREKEKPGYWCRHYRTTTKTKVDNWIKHYEMKKVGADETRAS